MSRIIITGGSGFVGTNLVQYHVDRGDLVLNLDAKSPRNSCAENSWKSVDILDRTAVINAVRQFNPDYFYHLAARTDLNGLEVGDYTPNTIGLENVIEALSKCGNLQRVVFASSRLVCKIGYQPKSEHDYCPSTIYGESKVIGEGIVRRSDLIPCSWVMVRPTSIWGPWFGIPYKTFFLSIANGTYVHPGPLEIRKSFGYVGNTAHQLAKLLEAPAESVNRRTIYLADYPPINVREMANCIQRHLGVKKIREVPISILKYLALAGDGAKNLGWSNPPLTSFRLDNLITEMMHDLAPLKELVGTLPFSMEEGVAETIEWLRAQREI